MAEGTDIKNSIFLPKTSFPMRGGLPKKEPEILDFWRQQDLYGQLRQSAKNRPKFVLHDGPPYANGHLHIGTGLNKILKDIVVRSRQMTGFDANFVPGWDCHGLPIEWKIEEQYRTQGKQKEDIPISELRQACRDFAQNWLNVQSEEFQRLGVIGDWKSPYTTMTKEAEAQILCEIHKFVTNGGLYRGLKPVLWSVVEKTALAEAEVEYKEHRSTTLYVRFPIKTPALPQLEGADLVIWTTTPWTIPANRAIAAGAAIAYEIYEVTDTAPDALVESGDRLVLACDLAETTKSALQITNWKSVARVTGSDLIGTICHHPFAKLHSYYQFPVPVLEAEFVTTEQGTGLVHIAPTHGQDDFILGQKHDLPLPETVAEDGSFMPDVALMENCLVYQQNGKSGNANKRVCDLLRQEKALAAQNILLHSYPHSWRSKAPLIFRATAQWFISMETNALRKKALTALDQTKFYPDQGRNRIGAMVASRPDWCISRQRAWGVPIAIFVEKSSKKILDDPEILQRTQEIFSREGSDAWFARPAKDFLGERYQPQNYDQIFDIIDVWFESGVTHSFVLEKREDLHWPADLYLEGSDQHRGWFHSALLASCGTRGRAPYEAILTHGFVLDDRARKMSKSLGNVIAPQEIANQYGADILRLWVANADVHDDIRIGPEIIKQQADSYRRLRNSLRYCLGGLAEFHDDEIVTYDQMPELERWVLARLAQLDQQLRSRIQEFDFNRYMNLIYQFCANDLSAFYFDIRKDSLYCDAKDFRRRRAIRSVLKILHEYLCIWLAPILPFTAEEAWQADSVEKRTSVHLQQFPDVPPLWRDEPLLQKWSHIRELRRVVTGALEQARADGEIGSSLQAAPVIYLPPEEQKLYEHYDLADIMITSDLVISNDLPPPHAFRLEDQKTNIAVEVKRAEGEKCVRCWKVLIEVSENSQSLCQRCADVISKARGR